MVPAISDLATKLDTLRRLDARRQVFGAATHKYLSKPASQSALAELEDFLGTLLPEEYRAWMLEVGSGAGPYHGLFSPKRSRSELQVHRTGDGGAVASPAKITMVHVDQWATRVNEAGSYVGIGITSDSWAGSLPLSHMGCSGFAHLVIVGEMHGNVFGESDDLLDEPFAAATAFWPDAPSKAVPAPSKPFSFLQWMDIWLEASLIRLGA